MLKRNKSMKKEYLILIALILIFSAYLLLHKENKDHYTLPEIEKIDTSKITGINIDKKQGPIKFTKKDDHWMLTDKKYLADSSAVENMLDTFKGLKLSALVSQKGNLRRYELDVEKQIRVKLLEGEKTIFELGIGKTAPTFNHTFVMLSDDTNVYHANGSFRSNFEKTEDDFRDKKVLEFKEDGIKEFSIEKEGLSKKLTAKEEKKDKEEISLTWSFADGTLADKNEVSNLLSSVSFLECEKYLESPTKNDLEKKPALCKIRLENEGQIALTLFKGDNEETIFGISSMNEYAFVLNQYNGKEIVSNIEKLLGIIKEQKDKE